MQYSGTGALKGDFTRTGKRNFQGLVNDGFNSLTRYYLNNFADGSRQDSFEVFLGNYIPDATASPFTLLKQKRNNTIKAVLLIGTILILTVSFLSRAEVGWGSRLAVVLFWATSAFVGLKFLDRFGTKFVDQPCLVMPKKPKQQ